MTSKEGVTILVPKRVCREDVCGLRGRECGWLLGGGRSLTAHMT